MCGVEVEVVDLKDEQMYQLINNEIILKSYLNFTTIYTSYTNELYMSGGSGEIKEAKIFLNRSVQPT